MFLLKMLSMFSSSERWQQQFLLSLQLQQVYNKLSAVEHVESPIVLFYFERRERYVMHLADLRNQMTLHLLLITYY